MIHSFVSAIVLTILNRVNLIEDNGQKLLASFKTSKSLETVDILCNQLILATDPVTYTKLLQSYMTRNNTAEESIITLNDTMIPESRRLVTKIVKHILFEFI